MATEKKTRRQKKYEQQQMLDAIASSIGLTAEADSKQIDQEFEQQQQANLQEKLKDNPIVVKPVEVPAASPEVAVNPTYNPIQQARFNAARGALSFNMPNGTVAEVPVNLPLPGTDVNRMKGVQDIWMQQQLKDLDLENPTNNSTEALRKKEMLRQSEIPSASSQQDNPVEHSQVQQTQPQQPKGWLGQLEAMIEDYNQTRKKNEILDRSDNARKKLAAISDALSSVANLVGAAKGGASANVGNSYRLVSENITRDKNLRDSRATRQQNNILDYYTKLRNGDLSRDRLNYLIDNQKQRAEQFSQKLGWSKEKYESERQKFYDKLASDNANFTAKEKQDAWEAELDRLSREKIANIGASARKYSADSAAQSSRYRTDKMYSDKEQKENYKRQVSSLASNWKETLESLPEEIRNNLDKATQYEQNMTNREKMIEGWAYSNPEWAKNNGLAQGGVADEEEDEEQDVVVSPWKQAQLDSADRAQYTSPWKKKQ